MFIPSAVLVPSIVPLSTGYCILFIFFINVCLQWLCDTDRILIAHRLPELEVFSYGSGYGGNSLLGKKCLALRIGSYLGWKEGWLAEHAALLSLTNPDGKEIFFCFSAPSGVGKTG